VNSPKEYRAQVSPQGTRIGDFENSRLVMRASQYAGGFPHPQKRHLTETTVVQTHDRDKYKEELKIQMNEKKKRE
jgi:hypothetical protein